MTTLMVWHYHVDKGSEDGYKWAKVPTDYKVGTREELLFWRVMDTNGATSSKDYFYSPHEYEAFSGIPMDQYKEQVDAWDVQHKAALKEFNITRTNTNMTTAISNERSSYVSFFSTPMPTESTVP